MKRVRLAAVAGASAVLYTPVIVAFALLSSPDALSGDATDVLRFMAEHRTRTVIAGWFFVAAPLCFAVAGLGFLEAFRSAGSMMWVAALGFIGGGFLALVRNATWLAMAYGLAPAYASATESDQSGIAAVGDTLLAFGFVIGDVVAGFLVGFVGVLLVSAGMLRSKLGPRWVAWLGVVVAFGGLVVLGGLLGLLGPLTGVLSILMVVAFPAFMFWLAAAGITVWRLPRSDST